jgi:hypothetical protein
MTRIEAKICDTLSMLAYALTRKVQPPIPAVHLNWLLEGEEFYLPDGGYSRIVVSGLTGEARLTSNSRAEVKAAWDNCKEMVADLERDVARARVAVCDDQIRLIEQRRLEQVEWEKYQVSLIGLGLTKRQENALRRAFMAGWAARESQISER